MNDNTNNLNNLNGANRAEPSGAAEHDLPTDLSRAEILRACADGESWAEARLGEAAREGDVSKQLAFERDLRSAVCRCCENEAISTPTELRACVEKLLRGSSADHTSADEPVGAGLIERTPAVSTSPDLSTHDASPAGGVLARLGPLLAVAAVLALCATLIINAVNSGPGIGWDESRIQNVASFITEQHNNCSAFGAGYDRKFTVPESTDAGTAFARGKFGVVPEWFGGGIEGMVVQGSYAFAGIAGCGVPGGGASVHMIFRPLADDGAAVSVFVQQAEPGDLEEDACYSCQAAEEKGRPVNFWAVGGYIVYVHADNQVAIQHAREAFSAPERLVGL